MDNNKHQYWSGAFSHSVEVIAVLFCLLFIIKSCDNYHVEYKREETKQIQELTKQIQEKTKQLEILKKEK